MRLSTFAGAKGLLVCFLLASGAHAAPVSFTIDSVFFDDSPAGMVSGTFDFDFASAIDPFSNINVTTSAGGAFAGLTYTLAVPGAIFPSGPGFVILTDDVNGNAGSYSLALTFDPVLNPGGGTATLGSAEEFLCTAGPFCSGSDLLRSYVAGASVPVPAAAWLFGSALGLLGWLRRRVA